MTFNGRFSLITNLATRKKPQDWWKQDCRYLKTCTAIQGDARIEKAKRDRKGGNAETDFQTLFYPSNM